MPLKKDYSMPSKIVAYPGLPKQATKHDHLDPLHSTIGWKRGIVLMMLGVATYVAASQFVSWCERHATVALLAIAAILTIILIDFWLRRIPANHLSQTKYPSSPTRW